LAAKVRKAGTGGSLTFRLAHAAMLPGPREAPRAAARTRAAAAYARERI
jgi:hypothetical protein